MNHNWRGRAVGCGTQTSRGSSAGPATLRIHILSSRVRAQHKTRARKGGGGAGDRQRGRREEAAEGVQPSRPSAKGTPHLQHHFRSVSAFLASTGAARPETHSPTQSWGPSTRADTALGLEVVPGLQQTSLLNVRENGTAQTPAAEQVQWLQAFGVNRHAITYPPPAGHSIHDHRHL